MGLPGNARRPVIATGTPRHAFGALGPELVQADKLEASAHAALFAGAVGEGRAPGFAGDSVTPQLVPQHVTLSDAVRSSSVGDDTGAESLPGRIRPAEWDGEPGWGSSGGGLV